MPIVLGYKILERRGDGVNQLHSVSSKVFTYVDGR